MQTISFIRLSLWLLGMGLSLLAAAAGPARAGFVTLDFPNAAYTAVTGVSGNTIVGYFNDGAIHGFTYDGTTFTTLNVPNMTFTQALGVSGNTVVGTFQDPIGYHGFIYNGTNYIPLDVPFAS